MTHEKAKQPDNENPRNQSPAADSSQPGILRNLTVAEQAFIDRKRANSEVLTDQQIALGIRQLREIGALKE